MKKYILGSIYVYGSTVISSLAGALRLFLIAKYLTPQAFGYWNIILTIFGYFNFSHIGITDGLIKKASSISNENHIKNSLYNYANNAVLIINLIINLIFFVITYIYFFNSPINIFLLAAPFILLNIIYQYFIISISVLRIEERFFYHGIATALPNIISLFIVIILFNFNKINLENLLYVFTFSYLIAFVYAKISSKWKINFRLNFSHIKSFFITGFPIISSAFIFNIYLSFDRWIILRYFDVYELGIFSFPQNISRIALLAGTSLSYVFYTKFIKDFSKNNLSKNKSQFNSSVNLLSIVSLFLIIVCFYSYPLFIEVFFIKYKDSIEYIGPLLLSVYFLSIYSLLTNFLIAINKIKIIFKIILPAFLFDVILQITSAKVYGSITLIIFSRAISIILIVTLMLQYIYKHFFKYKNSLSKIFSYFYFILAFLIIEISYHQISNISFYFILPVRIFFLSLFITNSFLKLKKSFIFK